jgi:hypothetical protein
MCCVGGEVWNPGATEADYTLDGFYPNSTTMFATECMELPPFPP